MVQLYALDNSLPVTASQAVKTKNYLCPECQAVVRLRQGPFRQAHFYHLKLSKNCRQQGKSLIHMHLQLKLFELLGQEVDLEYPFPAVSRIADVAWHKQKIIFEIQCSGISLEEVQTRVANYRQVGYTVIWILHEKQFNKKRISAAELYLRHQPCYFTNINSQAEGLIYDQFEVFEGHLRLFKGPKLRVFLEKISLIPSLQSAPYPKCIEQRLLHWSHYVKGDLIDHAIRKECLQSILMVESQFKKNKIISISLINLLKQSYRATLQWLLKVLT